MSTLSSQNTKSKACFIIAFILNSKAKALKPLKRFNPVNSDKKNSQTAVRAWVYLILPNFRTVTDAPTSHDDRVERTTQAHKQEEN